MLISLYFIILQNQQKISLQKQKMLRENTQRLRSQQSAYLTTSPSCGYNWRDQYFPKTDEPLQKWSRQSQYQNTDHSPQQYQSLAKMYQMQNEQIQQTNNQLLNKVREYKQKQQILMQEIAELQAYYRKLLKNVQTDDTLNDKENRSQQFNRHHQSQVTNYNMADHLKNNQINTCSSAEEIVLPCRNQKQTYIRDLNDQFCKLVQESITEKNATKRKQLRKQLAQLASQMKKVRNIEGETNLKSGPKVQRVQKTLKTQRSSDIIFQTPTNKTLAPYLENNSSNKVSIAGKLTYSSHENHDKKEKLSKKLTHSHSNSNFANGSASTTATNFKKF